MVVTTVLLVFVVIPNSTQTPNVLQSRQLASPQVITESIEDAQSRHMLNSHYSPARETIPIDAPIKRIGECPYSKPQSTDLPIPDIPINVAMISRDMRLS